MRTGIQLALMHLLLAGPCCALALADGGQVRLMQLCGDYRVTVFTAPNPLRAGPIDVSVLVQYAATGEVITDAQVNVVLTGPDQSHPPLRAAATTAAATNKLLRAALFDLPAAGEWGVRVSVTTAASAAPLEVAFTAVAAPPQPRWLAVWPWFTWPIVAVTLFTAHRALVGRATRRHAAYALRRSAPFDALTR